MARNANAARETETENETVTETETGKAANANKRQSKATVTYSTDGSENSVNSPTAECKFIHVEFADETARKIEFASLPESVRICAGLQGVVTRFQRSYQTLKEIDKVVEAFDETLADLENGVWIEFAAGEPKVTQLAKAVAMALEAKGEEVDEARRQSIIDKLKNADFATKAKENPQVMANLATLQLEAAKKRADERMKAASESNAELTGF